MVSQALSGYKVNQSTTSFPDLIQSLIYILRAKGCIESRLGFVFTPGIALSTPALGESKSLRFPAEKNITS